MPYMINKRCTGGESACVDACPYDCIYPNENAFLGQPPYKIDAELCADCGACALVCPELAIAPVAEFGRYAEAPARLDRTPRGLRLVVTSGPKPAVEAPAFQVILNEWTDTFVASHV